MTREKLKQTPEWRKFEKLVARVEQMLVPSGVTVRSPDRIRSLLTNRLREVDASIRTKVGSAEILITLECRKRKAKQDVTWMEQLSSKKKALGAHKTIAISSSEFSSDAIQAAEHYGIDLRVVRDLADEEIESWLFPVSIVHVYKHTEIKESPNIEFEMLLGETETDYEKIDKTGIEDRVFSRSSGDDLNLNEIWNLAERQHDIYSNVPMNGQVMNVEVTLECPDELKILTPAGPRRVRRIVLRCALSWKKEEIPLSDAKLIEYTSASTPSTTSIGRAEFETKEASKNNVLLGIQTEKDSGKLAVSLQLIDPVRSES